MKIYTQSAFTISFMLLFLLIQTAIAQTPQSHPQSSAPRLVQQIKVLPDKAPDCSSLKAIVESVTRDCQTNDEKAIAIYNFMRLTHYHRAYPSEPGGIPVLKEINCYGWSLCGGLHAEQSALWREMGWDWRFVGWPGHTTVEAFYDGRWHYLDVFLKFYAWMPDPKDPQRRTIAGQDDLAADSQNLLLDAFVMDESRKVMYAKGNEFELIGDRANWQAPAFLVCGDEISGIVDGTKHRNRVGPTEGWGGMLHKSGGYSADVDLAPGFALTNSWDKSPDAWYWSGSQIEPCHTCGDKEIRNSPEKGPIVEPYLGNDWKCESYANGQIDFRADLNSDTCLQSFTEIENVKFVDGGLIAANPEQPARVTVLLQSPYILTQATGSATGIERLEVSVDKGQHWQEAKLADFGATVAGHVQALLRLTIRDRLQDLQIHATVQNNPFALPYLSPGKNIINVSVADPQSLGDNQLVVTYAYRTGARFKSYEQLCLEGKEIARAHDATWDKTPTVVQKRFGAHELPAKFEIDVPTPTGMHPVFPRMLFVRREVIGPNQDPIPVDENAKPATIAADEQLLTLPNPLLTGTQPPPARPVRPIETRKIELTPFHFVTSDGVLVESSTLRWPKTDKEQVDAIAFLIGGDLGKLPELSEIASARLVFPLIRAHQQAPTKIGVTALQAKIIDNKPYDFSQLGEVISTTVIPTLSDDAANWSPPKEFQLDVTREIRSIIIGDAQFHGFALRVVPDRSVDDGWTVRVQFPAEPTIYLELETYKP
jgi:hypothetical protein